MQAALQFTAVILKIGRGGTTLATLLYQGGKGTQSSDGESSDMFRKFI